MAEPKDDPDAPHFVHKMSNHLGNSRLEETLNDFLELHSEELRLELRRADSSLGSGEDREGGGMKHGKHGQDLLGETVQRRKGEQGSGFESSSGFSHRVHSIYQEFLAVVQGNLEEFLEAEGLTEAQLRDACEQEMQAKDPGGLSFMHTLISSWEFPSFIALVSGFLDEGAESEEEEEEEEEEGDDASSSSPSSSCHGEDGAQNFDGRGRRGRGPPCTSSNSSRSSRSGSASSECRKSGGVPAPPRPRSPSPVAAGVVVVADDSSAAEGRKEIPPPSLCATTARSGLDIVRRGGGGAAAAAVAATEELDGRENAGGEKSGVAAACCAGRTGGQGGGGGGSGHPPGIEPLFLEAKGAVGSIARAQRFSVPELPTRAEAKS